MPKPKSDGGWLLPAIIDPPERKAVCICIPNEINHVTAFWGALQELSYWFNWQRDAEHKALPTSLVWADIVREAHQKWLDGVMCTSCAELIECLQPLIDELNAKLDSIQTTVNNTQTLIENQTDSQKLQAPAPFTEPTCNEAKVYSGAIAVIQQMNDMIMDIFEEAEASAPDNQREWADLIWSSVPVLETLPVDEMFFLVDWYFANQMTDYQADYTTTWVDEAACILYCNVVANDCVLDYETLGNSLSQLRAAFPGNKAADIYARFGDATTPTLGTQIGMFINEIEGGGAGTLKDFFYNLIQTFGIGAQSENPGYGDCNCPEDWCYQWDFTEGDTADTVGGTSGVIVTLGANGYEGTITSNYGGLSVSFDDHVKIPAGIAIQKWEFDCYRSNPNTLSNPDRFGNYGSGMAGTLINYTDYGATGDYTHEFVADITTSDDDYWQYDLQVDNSGVSANLVMRMYRWRIYGNSVPPAGLSGGNFITP